MFILYFSEISEQPLKEKCSNLVAEFHDFQKYLLKTVKDIRFNLTNKIANNMSRIDDAVQSGIIPILRDALKHTSEYGLHQEFFYSLFQCRTQVRNPLDIRQYIRWY